MRPLGPRLSHFWKLQNMLRVTGTDATEAFDQGDLTQKQWAELVETCRGCQWTGGCNRYMERARLAGHQEDAPPQCRNQEALAALRAAHPEVA
ncbi:DUF6455 family protein [Primorskyibacter aestuariivivens]|uniref:DUF6455 family protein n=1 Tax=Primorskyibacter aestuariivivens TaxID=1888912 RepID=UPI0023011899|nr:DUF6455 family protein [Primorskyibacter aestuariivivens]MDA7429964.1 DUF6455 family protein [Primorskyibacter aestuariivivens]